MQEATDIAQMIIAAVTAVGVVASILFARQALIETRRDREAREAPFTPRRRG